MFVDPLCFLFFVCSPARSNEYGNKLVLRGPRIEEGVYVRKGIFLYRQAAQEAEEVRGCLTDKHDAEGVRVRRNSSVP